MNKLKNITEKVRAKNDPCENCEGKGIIIHDFLLKNYQDCKSCKGKGYVQELEFGCEVELESVTLTLNKKGLEYLNKKYGRSLLDSDLLDVNYEYRPITIKNSLLTTNISPVNNSDGSNFIARDKPDLFKNLKILDSKTYSSRSVKTNHYKTPDSVEFDRVNIDFNEIKHIHSYTKVSKNLGKPLDGMELLLALSKEYTGYQKHVYFEDNFIGFTFTNDEHMELNFEIPLNKKTSEYDEVLLDQLDEIL
jgi:hypothetical protein